MEKRIFLAVVISIALLGLWSWGLPKFFPELAKKPEPAKVETATKTTTTPSTTATTDSGAAPAPPASTVTTPISVPQVAATAPVSAERVQTSRIDTPEFTAVFSNRGAQLISFELKNYKRKDVPTQNVDLVRTREPNRADFPFAFEPANSALKARLNSALYSVSDRMDRGERVLEYRYSDGQHTATKTFRFDPARPYLFDYTTSIQPPTPYRVVIGPGIRNIGPEEVDSAAVITGNGVVQSEGKFDVIPREKGDAFQVLEQIDYIGIEDNYFLTVLRPSTVGQGVLDREQFTDLATKKKRQDFFAGVNAPANGIATGNAFFGPKETKLLDAYGFGEALQFGWFGLIARYFLIALVWINQYTRNYGFAIIVLTVIIKIVLYPLQHKSNVSMKKMQRVGPKIEQIKAKYKKSKTDTEQRNKMNMEMMQLYQKEGINPMAGCLPLVLQLPILWGFYNLLSRAIELRGAEWMLWIKDLSEKDPTYVLPILMTATMFLQTYLTPATGDPAQRKMFLIMPLVFGFLFKDFPSGLVLYWLVQNILTIVQMLIMNKWWKDHPDDLVKELKDDEKK
ncbi:MAG TPA: membrane protein insertase YidC [Thermoanaerobaculia bacterium]|jgi:YidC/Oxa1 family membrane protein insertase|nr:membrane protein insertase YidC [Thermoanaerobaculia bacterium]